MSKLLKAIAAAEVIGGAALLVKVAPALGTFFSQGLLSPKVLLVMAYLLSFSVLSLVAGVLLWRSSGLGLSLSAAIQLLQVPWLELSRFTYKLVDGLSLTLRMNIETGFVGLAVQVGEVYSTIGPTAKEQHLVIGVNIAALAFLIHLLRR